MTGGPTSGAKWVTLPYHRSWLLDRAGALFDFFEAHSIDPAGGFFSLDDLGQSIVAGASSEGAVRELHATARMVYCFAISQLLGRPGAARFIDHGMGFLWSGHRDSAHGGYFWSVGKDGPRDDRKQAYGHAFVLLAASSAKVVGHPDADRLLANVSEVLLTRFWEPGVGAAAEEFDRNWSPVGHYRGQNSNMAVLLLKGKDNISSNNESYAEKLKSYAGTLLWNETLRTDAYKSKLDFKRMMNRYALHFEPYDSFGPIQIEARQRLLFDIVSVLWSDDSVSGARVNNS